MISVKELKLFSFVADEHLGGENIYESSAFRDQFFNVQLLKFFSSKD